MMKSIGMLPPNSEHTWTLKTPASAFQVLPAATNAFKYPVTVKVNPDDADAETFVVTGPHEHRKAGPGGIRVVKLALGTIPNTMLESGYDRWELFVGETDADMRRSHLLTSSDGYTATRMAPAVDLFTMEYSGKADMQLFQYSGDIYFQLLHNTPKPGSLTVYQDTALTLPWNLSDFRGMRYEVMCTGAYPGASEFTPFVELYARNENVITNTSTMGWGRERLTLANLGGGSTVRVTSLVLGAGATTIEGGVSEFKSTVRWAPYVRVGVRCVGATFPNNSPGTLLSNALKFRFSASAW